MAKGNKGRGNRYELECRKLFRDLGFEECETSRYASRKLDDAKVDLTDTGPFNVQCKWYSDPVKNPLYYYNVLAEMPVDSKYNIIFHKVRGKKQFVVMYEDDWEELLDMLKLNNLPYPMQSRSLEERRYRYENDPLLNDYSVVSHYHNGSGSYFSIMKRKCFIEILEMLIKNKVI